MKEGRLKSFLLGLGILAGAVLIVFAMHAFKEKPEETDNTKPPLMVSIALAEYKEQSVSTAFQGEVRAKTNIELVTQVTGKVMHVSEKFIEGGRFEPGEVLLQIDDSDYQVALKSAQANVAAARVEVEIEQATAATNAREWKDLQGKPIEEANPLRLNKPQIIRAKARLSAAEAELAAAQLNYERTKISAPFAGRIMTKSAELGQFMSRGGSVGRVFSTAAMEIRLPMTDVQLSELGIKLGYSAAASGSLGLPAKVSTVFGITEQTWKGFLRSVDASIDNETRLLYATVVVDHPFSQSESNSLPLAPGLFVDVELESPEQLTGLEIPRSALKNGRQVYVIQNNELQLKTVDVVFTSTDFVIVGTGVNGSVDVNQTSGLADGDQVIVSSVPGAYNGMPVKLSEAVAPPPTDAVSDKVVPDSVVPDSVDPEQSAPEEAEKTPNDESVSAQT